MTIERFILIAIAIMSVSSTIYIPRDKIRIALLSFLVFQAATWLVSIILVQSGKIIFPVRLFIKATAVNFIPQFLFYPTIFMWFILLFPSNRNMLLKLLHYIIFTSIMMWFIYFTSKYTHISNYSISNDYQIIKSIYIRTFAQYIICHLYITWFFKEKSST